MENKFFSNKISYNPDTEYGKSKLVGDLNIMKSNCFYSILRFPGIYGFSGPGHLGINVSIKKTNSILNHCAVPFINLSSFDIAIDKDQKINVIKIEASI